MFFLPGTVLLFLTTTKVMRFKKKFFFCSKFCTSVTCQSKWGLLTSCILIVLYNRVKPVLNSQFQKDRQLDRSIAECSKVSKGVIIA